MRAENDALWSNSAPVRFARPAQARAQRRRRRRGAEILDAGAACRQRVERHIDAIEIAVIVAAILQVIDDLQRGAQRVVGGPGGALLAVHVAARSGRPASPNSCNSRSGRPSRGSAAWSRPCGRRSADQRMARREVRSPQRACAAPRPRAPVALPSRAGLQRSRCASFVGAAQASRGRRCRRRCARNGRRPGSVPRWRGWMSVRGDGKVLVAMATCRNAMRRIGHYSLFTQLTPGRLYIGFARREVLFRAHSSLLLPLTSIHDRPGRGPSTGRLGRPVLQPESA